MATTNHNLIDAYLLDLFQQNGVDILVHNLSHSDIVLNVRKDVADKGLSNQGMVEGRRGTTAATTSAVAAEASNPNPNPNHHRLSLTTPSESTKTPSAFARPKFTDFRKITKDLYDNCQFLSQHNYEDDYDSPRNNNNNINSDNSGSSIHNPFEIIGSAIGQHGGAAKSRSSSTSSASSLGIDNNQPRMPGSIPVIYSEVARANHSATTFQSPITSRGGAAGEVGGGNPFLPAAVPSSTLTGSGGLTSPGKALGRPHLYPCGFDINEKPLSVNLDLLRFRRDDKKYFTDLTDQQYQHDDAIQSSSSQSSSVGYIDKMFFPHMSILLPNWLDRIKKDGRQGFTKLLILISGAGTPSDQKSKPIDNSTKYTGGLIAEFVQQCYQKFNIKIIHLHSKSNLFRYDDNISFVKNGLMAHIHEIRYKLSQVYASEWKKYMKVSLSFADGNSARVSAIQASMRYYKPDYFHFWQLKTFWAEERLNMSDIEWHSFEEMSVDPAMDVACLSSLPEVQLVVDEMKRFKNEFIESIYMKQDDNDLSSFWLRKTSKPVLSVLLVKKSDGPYRLYRGTNMEVSMPTGSLCAERNVIGTALAADFTLKREDLKMVAVYSLPKLGTSISIDVAPTPINSGEYDVIEHSDSDNIIGLGGEESVGRHNSNSNSSSNNYYYDDNDAGIKMKRSISSDDGSGAMLLNNKRKIQRLHSFDPVVNSEFEVHSRHGNQAASNIRGSSRSNSFAATATTTTTSTATPSSPLFASMSKSESCVDGLGTLQDQVNATPSRLSAFNSSNPNPNPNPNQTIPVTAFRGSSSGSSRNMLCVETSETDMNPLKPCGACSEWLKKISEVNPQFSVVTFTDKYCQGVYIEEIAD